MSLAQKALGGFVWTFLDKFGSQGIQFLVLIVLARLLTPEDFGLIAMLMVFFAFSQSLIDSGFSQALIREKSISEEDKATTFTVNITLAIIMYLSLWFGAPYIANFFEEPRLIDLTKFMGLTLFFYSVTIVQRATFTQELRFKEQTFIQILSSILTGIIAIILAVLEFGVWALAYNYVLLSLFSSLLFYYINPWYPKLLFNKSSFDKLFGFGSKLMAVGLMSVLYQNIYKLIIGKLFAAATLGFYTQAKNFKDAVTKHFNSTIQKVTYPILSKTYESNEHLKNSTKKVLKVTSFLIFPMVIGLLLVAEPLILVTVGEQWLETVPILQLLCISGLLYHIHSINLNVLKVIGRSDLYLIAAVIRKINVAIVIIVAILYGFWALIIGQVISSYVSLFINMYYTSRTIKYTAKEQLIDLIPILLLSLPMVGFVYGVSLIGFALPILELLILVLTGVIVYGVTNLVFKHHSMVLLLNLLKPRIKFLEKYSSVWSG